MKIGIVTLSDGNDNYGGSLQAYALQTVLSRLGHEPFFMNTALRRMPSNILRMIEHPVRGFQRLRRFSRFVPFWEKNFNMDERGHRPLELFLDNPTPADALVCGSDQIWAEGQKKNPLMQRFSFLDFDCLKGIRVAYAPSWGTSNLDDGVLSAVTPMLRRFSAVSVREDSGVPLVERCGVSAKWVVDPTLLPEAGFWSAFADESTMECPDNLLFYGGYRWTTKVPPRAAIDRVRAGKGLKLVVPCFERPFEFIGSNAVLGPHDWVRYIRNAKFVVTNSFHCMVFSIIFHTPFAVLSLSGKYEGMNARIRSLCGRLHLEDRIVEDLSGVDKCICNSVDWQEVDRILAEWRSDSFAFLRDALSGEHV